jgi:nicotinamidase-related amidase
MDSTATAGTDYAQAFMDAAAIDPARAALVIVDMQYATGHPDGALARRMAAEGSQAITAWRFARIMDLVLPNTRRLIAAMRACGGEVVYVTLGGSGPGAPDAPPHMRRFLAETGNYLGSPDHRIVEELAPGPQDHIVRKTTVGAFASTGIDAILRARRREALFFAGVSTNMCVDTTAREAADRGYPVTLVADACATTHQHLHEAALQNFQRFFGRVRTTDAVLAELSGVS